MIRIAVIVALGGFLMGFDASVISGVVGSVEETFALMRCKWAGSLHLLRDVVRRHAVAGLLSDRIGRRTVLRIAALLFLVSAIASALAPDYVTLVLARMLGGLGVGAALILAPMYIAELAPARARGRLVSVNQLNIVIGISVAFFSNYLLNQAELGAVAWRWMLGVEAVPAIVYLVSLFAVPESPRWLLLQGDREAAERVLRRTAGEVEARATLASFAAGVELESSPRALLDPALRTVLAVGLLVAVLQQITGINAVFFYASMIFEQTGIGTDVASRRPFSSGW